jgi:hypothetical protein
MQTLAFVWVSSAANSECAYVMMARNMEQKINEAMQNFY